jgi:pilus assembly protein CpaE
MDNNSITVLLIGMKPEVEATLATALGHQTVRGVPSAAAARALLHGTRAPVVVARLDEGGDMLTLVRELSAKNVSVVAVGARKEPDLILAAMRAGAREFFDPSEVQPLERAVQGLLAAAGTLRFGKITAVIPAKGGMGATTLATNLAGAFACHEKRVCLVDLDLELGDVLSFLDVRGTYALADIAANVRRLDRELLDQSMPRHDSGIWVASQTDKMAEAEGLDADKVVNVIRFLRTHYDHLILDGVQGFGDLALAGLDLADHIVLVVTQEVPAVRSAQRCAEIFARIGYAPSRITLVVNRFQKSSTITTSVIEETVKLPVAATIGNDFHTLSRAVNQGVLAVNGAAGSVVAKDIKNLAMLLAPPTAVAVRPSFLKRFLTFKAVAHGAQ